MYAKLDNYAKVQKKIQYNIKVNPAFSPKDSKTLETFKMCQVNISVSSLDRSKKDLENLETKGKFRTLWKLTLESKGFSRCSYL